jgi:hypothetical protein
MQCRRDFRGDRHPPRGSARMTTLLACGFSTSSWKSSRSMTRATRDDPRAALSYVRILPAQTHVWHLRVGVEKKGRKTGSAEKGAASVFASRGFSSCATSAFVWAERICAPAPMMTPLGCGSRRCRRCQPWSPSTALMKADEAEARA